MRDDGELYTIITSGASSFYERLDTGNGSIDSSQNLGISTFYETFDAKTGDASLNAYSGGITFNAMTEAHSGTQPVRLGGGQLQRNGAVGVGRRLRHGPHEEPAVPPQRQRKRHQYPGASGDRLFTNVMPYAALDSAAGTITGLAIQGNTLYAVDDKGNLYSLAGINATSPDTTTAGWDCATASPAPRPPAVRPPVSATVAYWTKLSDPLTLVKAVAGEFFTGLGAGPPDAGAGARTTASSSPAAPLPPIPSARRTSSHWTPAATSSPSLRPERAESFCPRWPNQRHGRRLLHPRLQPLARDQYARHGRGPRHQHDLRQHARRQRRLHQRRPTAQTSYYFGLEDPRLAQPQPPVASTRMA